MLIRKKVFPIKKCLVCGTRFRPKVKWQKYDKGKCNKKAFDIRLAQKIERLDRMDSKGAA